MSTPLIPSRGPSAPTGLPEPDLDDLCEQLRLLGALNGEPLIVQAADAIETQQRRLAALTAADAARPRGLRVRISAEVTPMAAVHELRLERLRERARRWARRG